ncbi:uncharacterized protein BCR38DRAFT_479533 [Pseudomassariella vexata]|uniref:WSC domain-containing protein n=1 Tax=Pseudomassariella vexata TaxID=1141098 RepID=A0A1Y2EHG6_9PEZI|nr:uncharacterized protein BCR38DRAFT_479533 [Pseudomassariella vexata]ORY71003.1 hypothetical protein BCR38DRAFT_479533 [Pseudomassariella vexata]
MACATEIPRRAVTGLSSPDDAMTIELCKAFCIKNKYSLAGIDYDREASGYMCLPLCTGSEYSRERCDNNHICGGRGAMNMDKNGAKKRGVDNDNYYVGPIDTTVGARTDCFIRVWRPAAKK